MHWIASFFRSSDPSGALRNLRGVRSADRPSFVRLLSYCKVHRNRGGCLLIATRLRQMGWMDRKSMERN
jgi:hypothetical protein